MTRHSRLSHHAVARASGQSRSTIFVALAVLGFGFAACKPSATPLARSADSVVVEKTRIGQTLPTLSVATFSGDSATVGGPAQQPVTLLNVWATFCGPCIREFPSLEAFHQRYASRGLRVLAVSIDHADGEVKKFLMAHPVTFRIGRDPGGVVTTALANPNLPQTVLVSSNGRVLNWSEGFGNDVPPALIAAIDSSLGGR